MAALLDLPMVTIAAGHISAAIDIEERYRISFWDSLIVAAAIAAEVELLYTEDLSHRQRYGSITVHNPFLDS